jgi:hypothetical protein
MAKKIEVNAKRFDKAIHQVKKMIAEAREIAKGAEETLIEFYEAVIGEDEENDKEE